MGWKPRLPAKTVEQALAAVLPTVPATHVEPTTIDSDEDVLEMAAEVRRQDPVCDRLALVRQRARIMRVDAAHAKKRRA